jgi:hypothetical protein
VQPSPALLDHAVGEASVYVQGESLKTGAALLIEAFQLPGYGSGAKMRVLLGVALAILSGDVAAAQTPAAFGIPMGTPITSLVLAKRDIEMERLGIYQVIPPVPNGLFDFYMVVATQTRGVCVVTASGDGGGERREDVSAGKHISIADGVLRSLSEKYGAPTKNPSGTLQWNRPAAPYPFDSIEFSSEIFTLIDSHANFEFGRQNMTVTYKYFNSPMCNEERRKAGL